MRQVTLRLREANHGRLLRDMAGRGCIEEVKYVRGVIDWDFVITIVCLTAPVMLFSILAVYFWR